MAELSASTRTAKTALGESLTHGVRGICLTLEGIYSEGKDELYKWRRAGDVETNPRTISSMDTQREIEAAAKNFVQGCIASPRNKQPPLRVGIIEYATAVQADALGIPIAGKHVALDHDYTRHTLLHHGGPNERSRGQEPITDADLAMAGTILNPKQEPQARDAAKIKKRMLSVRDC